MKTILALAGDARRMKRVAKNIPKCMLKIAEKPILGYLLDSCLDNNMRSFIIAIKPKYRDIIDDYINESYISNGFEIDVEYDEQTKVKGTAPALNHVLENFSVGSECFIMWGDMLPAFEVSINFMHTDAAVVVYTHGNYSHKGRFDEVRVGDNNRVTSISSPSNGCFYTANSGIYHILHTPIFKDAIERSIEHNKDKDEIPVEIAINKLCDDGKVIPKYTNMFIDVGTEESYLENKSFIERMMIR